MRLSSPLQDFVGTVDGLMARDLALPRLMELLTPEFGQLAAVPDLLSPEAQEASHSSYAQHVLYTCPSGRFCLVALVWRAGDRTPVHDHHGWGLASVYRGHERETRYAWSDRPGAAAGLRPTAVQEIEPGEVIRIVPPGDIHRVANPDPTPTVSIHLYGFDLRTSPSGSSVRRVYGPELLIRDAPAVAALSR